jgi:hypothetical protein
MCRIDPSVHEKLVEKHGCRTMDFTHRPMIGYILIEEAVLKSNIDFDYWINLALEFNVRAKSSKRSTKNKS